MSIAWTRLLDLHIAEQRVHTTRLARDGRALDGFRRLSILPLRRAGDSASVAPARRAFSGGHAGPVTLPRGPRSFAAGWLLPKVDRPAVPSMRAALDALAAVVASTQDVLAAQAHVAARKAARSPNP